MQPQSAALTESLAYQIISLQSIQPAPKIHVRMVQLDVSTRPVYEGYGQKLLAKSGKFSRDLMKGYLIV
jgi:hypothetical protein